MSQDNNVMKQLTDMLYTDVIQKLEPPLPQVPTDTKDIDTEDVRPSQQNIDTKDVSAVPPPPPTDEEGSEFQEVEGEANEEGNEFQEMREDNKETNNEKVDEDEEKVEQDAELIRIPGPSINANEFSFEDIIADDELNLEGSNEKHQKQIIKAALAALIASIQEPIDEPTITEKSSEELNEKEKQTLINVALASLIASKQKQTESDIDESPNKKIIKAALAALLASTQKGQVEIKDDESQHQIVNAALAALIGSKIKADEKVPSNSYFRGITMPSMPNMGSVKDVIKDLYQNIPTFELPKFTSNIFEGLLEPDLDYYEVPAEIRSKIETQYSDYKVVVIKCSNWDNDKKCRDKDGKYYLYTNKDDKPKIISLDLNGNEIK